MMLDHPALPWLALGLAVCLVPVYGLGPDVDRTPQADVVDGSQAYLGEQVHETTLNASNGYQDDALSLTHNHVDTATLTVWVNNTDAGPRFVFPQDPLTLSAGGSATIPIEDTDDQHPTGTYTVDARIEVDVEEGTETVGGQAMRRSLTVVVE